MLSLQYIREHPAEVRDALARRHAEVPLEDILELDAHWRMTLQTAESLRSQRNEASKQMSGMKDRASAEFERLRAEMRDVGDQIKEIEADVSELETRRNSLLDQLPNIPNPDVPDGEDEGGNQVSRTWGEPRSMPFQPKPHWELGESLGIIDFERGQKLSGSRFYVLRSAGAKLQRALITWMLDVHVQNHGYTEVYLPFMVRGECLYGAGQLPKFADNLYRDIEEDLWMVPTAEVPITNLYRDEILSPDAVPIYHVAYTPCFRREKMSAGKDVRGIKRGHQFDKVEMYKFVKPDTSGAELQKLLDDAEDILRLLDLPYRVVELCTGDLGFSAAQTYDLEVWAPGCDEWLEVSSCSNCSDFQSRRANIRYRPEHGARPEYLHTLNGSGLALPRVMIAIMESYQQEDGSIIIPDILKPYMAGIEVIR
ncbi:MAG: serine--tRNA ligase [Dehalococcoidia bacterium]|nr:serine--tRNA ligase [Dehalococcoidia bacterium]